jgi:Raf kinase inhibitor-like YbhB/YbcL family protein
MAGPTRSQLFALPSPLLLPNRTEGGGDFNAPDVHAPGGPRTEAGAFRLSSLSFENGGVIPERLAREGGVSPQLAWDNWPEGTAYFVIIMDDPDAQPVVGHTYVHWVALVPASWSSLDEGASSGGWTDNPNSLHGRATSTAYKGPLPPSGTHHYHIKIYALADTFQHPDFDDLANSTTAADTKTYTRERFESLFRADILSASEITGTYTAPERAH